ncbi:MAG TPA: hypothetical protein VH186_27315 [Chloroflexia bacterium]|nr:hypothetical protein [Chloroflexia bacterium]
MSRYNDPWEVGLPANRCEALDMIRRQGRIIAGLSVQVATQQHQIAKLRRRCDLQQVIIRVLGRYKASYPAYSDSEDYSDQPEITYLPDHLPGRRER